MFRSLLFNVPLPSVREKERVVKELDDLREETRRTGGVEKVLASSGIYGKLVGIKISNH